MLQSLGAFGVASLDEGKIVEERAHAGIGDPRGGRFVESPSFELHRRRLSTCRLDTQRAVEPQRATLDEAFDVLPANQRDVVAKPLTEQLGQRAAMVGLLVLHARKDLGRRRIVLAKPLGEIRVHTFVLFLE